MGNKNNIDTKTLDRKFPILVWIDQNVNNKENSRYKNMITKEFKYKIFVFTSVTQAIENLKKIEFIQTFIICSGKSYIKFIKLFKENINDFMICPKIIIFTRNKNDYIKRNKNDENLFLDHPFYNWGGVENKFKEIIKFLKNEKKNKTIELETKARKLILKISTLKIKQFEEKSGSLNENYNYDEENDEEDEKFYAEVDNYLDEIIEENEKDENSFPFENKNNEEEKLSFPFYFNRNQDYLFPNIENDELNPFKELHSSKKEDNNKFWYGDDYESIQYNFEYIVKMEQLILPLFLSFYIKKPEELDVRKFNHFMLDNYSEAQKLVYLFDQLDLSYHIPNEVVSKYWVRAYTAETNFYKNMNKELRLDYMNPYLPFIHMMYEGVKIKSFSYTPKNKLYRGAYFDNKEILLLIKSLKDKNKILPGCIVYSKSFLSFSLDLKIAMKFKKNILLIIEEFTDGLISCPGCASIKKFSFIKKEEEILVFPFSCFEINRIDKIEEKEKEQNYYIIYLNYLGKYEKLFKGIDPEDLIEEIPEDSFLVQEVFKTDIIDKKYKDKFNRKKGFKPKYYNLDDNELYDNNSLDENELYDNNNMDENKLHYDYEDDIKDKGTKKALKGIKI